MVRVLRVDEYWNRARRRMIAETERFLLVAIQEPFRAPVIPSFPVGRGRFSPAMAGAFWRRVLFDDDAGP